MDREFRLKQGLLQVLISILLCIGMILIKFVFHQEELITSIYNYLITDIVFHGEM